MKSKLRMLLVFLVVLTMVMPSGLAYAATNDGNASSQNEAADPDLEVIDPDTLNVPKLGTDLDLKGLRQKESKEVMKGVIDPEEIANMDKDELNKKVRVSIFLSEPSALQKYSVKEANSAQSKSYRSNLEAKQNDVIKKINSAIGKKLNVKWQLTLAVNAISAEVTYADVAKILKVKGVARVEREKRYEALKDEKPAKPNTSITSSQMTGAGQAWAEGYNGAGTRIAIIDTGIDLDHQSFDAGAFDNAIAEDEANGVKVDLMTEEDIPDDLNGKGVYYSSKIPYVFNYVDYDLDVIHVNDRQGEHGSHVSGIAAANRYVDVDKDGKYEEAADTVYAVGMAPDAQILVMKVFGKGGGAYDSDYTSAIEDAIVLGCDSCNLSLGSSSAGFTFSNGYQEIFDELSQDNDGMVVSISAGNSGSWADNFSSYGDYGDLFVDDVNFDTVGSPGSYINALTVASAENLGTTGTPLKFNESDLVYFTEGSGDITDLANDEGYDYVYIDTVGYADDYKAVDEKVSLEGKIVIVNRGTLSFYQKGNFLIDFNPAALVVANNQPGTISMALDDYEGEFPMVSITLDDGNAIKEGADAYDTIEGVEITPYDDEGEIVSPDPHDVTYYTGKVGVSKEVSTNITGDLETAEVSDFSSWGIPGSLIMKPEITAPGGNIYSVAGTNTTQSGTTAGGPDKYELMSGTSMAAPHIAGMSAVLKQFLNENDLLNEDLQENFTDRQIAQSLLMSTAVPMTPYAEDGYKGYLPVIQQGAGLADVSKAVDAGSVLMMNDAGLSTSTGASQDGKVKVELGEDPDRAGFYEYSFTLYNTTDDVEEFELSTDMFVQDIDYDGSLDNTLLSSWTRDIDATASYSWNSEEKFDAHDVDKDGDTDGDDAQAILDYLTGENDGSELSLKKGEMDKDGKLTSKDAQLLLNWTPENYETSYVLPAKSKAEVTVQIQINEDLSDYPAGTYIEGYTYAHCVTKTAEGVDLDHTHSIPILGYYGSFTEPSMYDKVSYNDALYAMEYGSEDEQYNTLYVKPYVTPETNFLSIRNAGDDETIFTGNPYAVEEDGFPYDRLAIRSDSKIKFFYYNLIRSAGSIGYIVDSLIEGEEGPVDYKVTNNYVDAPWYDEENATYEDAFTRTVKIDKTADDYGFEEGNKFRVGMYAIPEYYAMLINDYFFADYREQIPGYWGTFYYNDQELPVAVQSGLIGPGAAISYDLTVDDTAPVITSAALDEETGKINVVASDNQNIAYIALVNVNDHPESPAEEAEFIPYDKNIPAAPEAEVALDASEAIENAEGYVAVFVGDYAGNEAAVAVPVNDTEAPDPTKMASIEIQPQTALVFAGQNVDLTTKILPITATDKNIVWTSADEGIATVSETGTVTGVKTGETTVRATSASDETIYGECTVKVLEVDKEFHGMVFDEEGNVHFAHFNTAGLPKYEPDADCDLGDMMAGFNYYGNILVEALNNTGTGELYIVDPENGYAAEKFGDFMSGFYASDIAVGTDDLGFMAYSYGPYLLLSDLEPNDDGEYGDYYTINYNASAKGESINITGVAYAGSVEAEIQGATYNLPAYYYTDVNGDIWYTEVAFGERGFTFTQPELVLETGMSSDDYLYDSLYSDGDYIYWSRYDGGDYQELFVINPENGDVFNAGNFGDKIWPFAGLYEMDAMSGETYDQGSATEPKEALSELNIEKIPNEIDVEALKKSSEDDINKFLERGKNAEAAEAEEANAEEPQETAVPEETQANEETAESEEAAVEETAEPEEAAVEETAEPEDAEASEEAVDQQAANEAVAEETEEAADGSLNSVRTGKSVKADSDDNGLTAERKDTEDEDEGLAVIEYSEPEETANGFVTVKYDPLEVKLVDTYSHLEYSSFHVDEKEGTINFAFANAEPLSAESVIASFKFKACEDGSALVTVKERNDDLELNEESTSEFEGAGHDWAEPTYKWSKDNKTVTATVTCNNNENHVITEKVNTTEKTTAPTCTKKGKTVYTAEFENEVFKTQTKTVSIKATGHDYGEYKRTRKATIDHSGILTKKCANCGKKVTMLVSPVVAKAKVNTGTKATVSWKAVKGAQRYQVYFGKCGKTPLTKVTKTTTGLSFVKTGLTKAGTYRFRVKAQRKINGKWIDIATGYTGHFVSGDLTKNGKYTNVKSISVKKEEVSLNTGRTSTIKATAAGVKKSKNIMCEGHTAMFRYISTNTDVATVSKDGKITAVAAGTCTVYVIGVNGTWKAVSVTVK